MNNPFHSHVSISALLCVLAACSSHNLSEALPHLKGRPLQYVIGYLDFPQVEQSMSVLIKGDGSPK